MREPTFKTVPLLVVFILAVGLAFLFAQDANLDLWTVAPDGRTGAITVSTTEADLKRVYGEANVKDYDVDTGEGMFENGTAIFSDDPARRIEILWRDSQTKRFPSYVYLRGPVRSIWKTVGGISVGTTLLDLERLNLRPFRLLGFYHDGSGAVMSWGNGRLGRDFGSFAFPDNRQLVMFLDPGEIKEDHLTVVRQVMGDREFSSGHPAMQTLNPRIRLMIFQFGER